MIRGVHSRAFPLSLWGDCSRRRREGRTSQKTMKWIESLPISMQSMPLWSRMSCSQTALGVGMFKRFQQKTHTGKTNVLLQAILRCMFCQTLANFNNWNILLPTSKNHCAHSQSQCAHSQSHQYDITLSTTLTTTWILTPLLIYASRSTLYSLTRWFGRSFRRS